MSDGWMNERTGGLCKRLRLLRLCMEQGRGRQKGGGHSFGPFCVLFLSDCCFLFWGGRMVVVI